MNGVALGVPLAQAVGDPFVAPATPLPGHSAGGDITVVSVLVVVMIALAVGVLVLLGWRLGLFRTEVPDEPPENH
ncbi:MAG: hypothetical protein ACREM8_09725 [Vulcanimicrobiaceae bacterium]